MLLALTAISIDAVLPVMGVIAASLELSPSQAQLMMSMLMCTVALGQLFFGPLADRFGRQPVTYTALGLYLCGSLLCANAESLAPLLTGRLLQGLGAAAGQIAARAILRDLYSGVKLAHALSGSTAVMAIAPLAAPLVGYLIADTVGWQWVFSALVCYALVMLVLAQLGIRETQAARDLDAIRPAVFLRSCAKILSHPQTLVFSFVTMFSGITIFCYAISGQYVYAKSFSATGWLVPFLHALLGFAVICGQVLNQRLIYKIGTIPTMVLSLTVALPSAVLCLLLISLGLLNAYGFGVYMAVAAMCMVINISNGTALAIDPHGRIAGLAVSIVGTLAFGLGTIIASVIARIADGEALMLLTYMCINMAVALIIVLWWMQRTRTLQAAVAQAA